MVHGIGIVQYPSSVLPVPGVVDDDEREAAPSIEFVIVDDDTVPPVVVRGLLHEDGLEVGQLIAKPLLVE